MLKSPSKVLDPFREWLDVRLPDRPLNAYQLLGLEPGEGHPRAIEEAVAHKRELLRGCVQQAGPVLWRHLYQEVNEAAEVLTDSKRKTEYDRHLFPAGVRAVNHQPHGPIPCGACGEVNPPTRAFCSGCGNPLLQPCAHCGAKNLSHESFCGVCGTNLPQALQECVDRFAARVDEAERLQADGYFDEALVLLSGMLSTAMPQLEDYVEQAKELLARLPERRYAAAANFAAELEQAQTLAEASDYEQVIEKLERLPAGLRTDEFDKLYGQCVARNDEACRLAREIREAVAAKQFDGLLEKVDCLLELKPDHLQAKKLQQQLAERRSREDSKTGDALRSRAKQLLAQHKFAEAAAALCETPDVARDEEFEKIYLFAKETAWLAANLAGAPVVDRALVAAAQRLAKLAPKFEHGAQLAAQAQAALQKGSGDSRLAAPSWMKPATRFPVVWLGGSRRIQPSETCDAAPLRERPGCFHVACGLALQGLERAAAPTNLLGKKKKKGMFGSLPRFARKATPLAAWGIDLSASGLKAVRLVRAPEGDAVKIDAVVVHEHDFSQTAPTEEDQVLTGLRSSLEKFLDGRTLGDDRICVSLGGIQILGRFLRLPLLEESKMADAVTFEVRHQIPVPLDDLAWDYHAFSASTQGEQAVVGESEVAVVAARQWQLKHPLGAFEQAGVDVHVVQSDCLALYNFLRYELEGEFPGEIEPATTRSPDENVFAVLDVGRTATNFVACSSRSIFFRSFPLGGDAFTRALVKEFNLTLAAAEELKRAPWKSRAMHAWNAALVPVFRNLMEEVGRSEKLLGRRRLERLYITGGGAQLHGLVRSVCENTLSSEPE